MIPWFPGGHADPWNHVEAAMALALGGRRPKAERAYDWLAATQHGDGSWFNYYLDGAIEDYRLDTNVIAYVATGVWQHYLVTRDHAFLERHVAGGRAGHRLRAAPAAAGRRDPVVDRARRQPLGRFALLTGSSSIYFSLRCAVAIAEHLGHERPEWELAAGNLASAVAYRPERPSSPRTAGPWTGTTRCSAAPSPAARPGPASPSAGTSS